MATAFTTFLLELKRLTSLSIRFDSEPLSEIVTGHLLTGYQMQTLTRFRLEMAYVNDTPSGCPIIHLVRQNKQLRHFHLACVDLPEDRWPMLFEALRIECDSLRTVEIWDPSEQASMVLIDGETSISICMSDDMRARLSKAQHAISIVNRGHDQNSISRYELYPDDSDYEFAEE